jgi:hypothetical protein
MKIAFCFFGILYGKGGKTGCERDFRHCWPNIKRMIVDPYKQLGFDIKLYFSSYPIEDAKAEKDFYEQVNPDKVVFSKLENSNAFTSKEKLFETFLDDDTIETVIYTRSDVHWNQKIINTNIDYKKFNFLFRERDWWYSQMFACDNLYIFPQSMSKSFHMAMLEEHASPARHVHKHDLPRFLSKYIGIDSINFMTEEHQYSDMNTLYTLCRNELRPECRGVYMNDEVAERFNYK